MTKDREPRCYHCVYREDIPGDCHLRCSNPLEADELGISGNPHGIKHGFFCWPHNFDPVWLVSCNGFEEKGE